MFVRFTLLSEMLGTNPANEEVFKDFVASKNPDGVPEELNLPEAVEERGTTVFRRHPDTKNLCIADYMVKGALKSRGDAIRARKGSGKEEKGRWGAIKGKLDDDLHVYPRFIDLGLEKPDGLLERPLRAMTAQGARVSLARSEFINAGHRFECEIVLREGRVNEAMLKEMLDEMKYVGMGQWRNSGHGRCSWEIVPQK